MYVHLSHVKYATLIFFFLLGTLFLFFKFNRVIFVLLSLEYMSAGLYMIFLLSEFDFPALFFLFVSIISSTFMLTILISIVKTYGSDYCYY